MATLIAVYTANGCVGRCDAKCYDATCPDCDCVCGGANHGTGKENAIENTRELGESWLEEYADRKGLSEFKTRTNRNLVDQFRLFSFSDHLQAAES